MWIHESQSWTFLRKWQWPIKGKTCFPILLTTLLTPNVWVVFLMLYNSDTKYPESAQIPEVSRFSPTRPTLTSGTSHQFQVVTCTSNQLGISQEFLQPPPWVWYLSRRAHRTQLTGKHYHLLLIKDKTQKQPGASLAVQWFRFCASNAGCMRSIPGAGTKIPHASWQGQKKKKNKNPTRNKIQEAKRKRFTGQAMWEWCELPCPLGAYHPPSTLMCSATQELAKTCHRGFLWGLHYVGRID